MKKSIVISIIMILIMTIFMGNVKAASATVRVSANKQTINIGETVTVTISFSVPVGTASFNLSYNGAAFQYISSTNTIRANANGSSVKLEYMDTTFSNKTVSSISATFKAVADGVSNFQTTGVVISDANADQLTANIGGGAAVTSIKPTNATVNKPTTNTNKKPNTTKKEEKEPQFGINSLKIVGIRNTTNGQGEAKEEKLDLTFSPKFSIDTYDYICNVDKTIERIEVTPDAGTYKDNMKIEGLNTLEPGENIITIRMSKEGKEDLIYTIKVIKEQEEKEPEVEETNKTKEETNYLQYEMVAIIGIIIIILIIAFIVRKIKNT